MRRLTTNNQLVEKNELSSVLNELNQVQTELESLLAEKLKLSEDLKELERLHSLSVRRRDETEISYKNLLKNLNTEKDNQVEFRRSQESLLSAENSKLVELTQQQNELLESIKVLSSANESQANQNKQLSNEVDRLIQQARELNESMKEKRNLIDQLNLEMEYLRKEKARQYEDHLAYLKSNTEEISKQELHLNLNKKQKEAAESELGVLTEQNKLLANRILEQQDKLSLLRQAIIEAQNEGLAQKEANLLLVKREQYIALKEKEVVELYKKAGITLQI